MDRTDEVILKRDVTALMVPEGRPTTLYQGEIITIKQMRGDSFTVANIRGSLFRIEGNNADALGKDPLMTQAEVDISSADPESIRENAWEMMRNVYDPEIPVNIVELGLIYQLNVKPLENADGQFHVDVVMTLTAPGCGMGPVLQNDVESGIKKLPGVASVNVEVVFDPPWSLEMMSDVAKVQLGMI